MANKYLKICLTTLDIKEMLIKITLRSHHTPVNMAIKKIKHKKFWWECGEKEPLYTVGGDVNQCSHSENQYAGSLKNQERNYLRSYYTTPRHV
jgi:hypothetical protein